MTRWLGSGFLTIAGAGLFALTSMMHAAFAYGETALDDPAAKPDIGLVMGGSGTPIPGSEYVAAANKLFIHPNFPHTGYPDPYANGLFTPEGLYPSTGVNSLPLDTSLSQGIAILDNAIQSNLRAHDASTVFGYSQSTLIASQEMALLDPLDKPSNLPVNFVLIGDELNPNGGALSRFDVPGDNTAVASLGINFYPATPADSFHTVVYTGEYDGYADFPRYPIDLLSDLNAEVGTITVHNTMLSLTHKQVTPIADGGDAIKLDTLGDTETTYYMIPTQNLPLLEPLRSIPLVGNPLADLFQPDLKVLVNLGYGPDNLGYSDTPANVPTTFGLFPDVNPVTVLSELLTGAQTGVQNAVSDISNEIGALSTGGLSSLSGAPTSITLPDLLTALSTTMASPEALASWLSGTINGLSAAASALYGTLLPTADIVNALLTSLPAYDAAVFLDNLGNPLDALALPIAADTGLFSFAGGLEFVVLDNTATAIASDLSGIIP